MRSNSSKAWRHLSYPTQVEISRPTHSKTHCWRHISPHTNTDNAAPNGTNGWFTGLCNIHWQQKKWEEEETRSLEEFVSWGRTRGQMLPRRAGLLTHVDSSRWFSLYQWQHKRKTAAVNATFYVWEMGKQEERFDALDCLANKQQKRKLYLLTGCQQQFPSSQTSVFQVVFGFCSLAVYCRLKVFCSTEHYE